jgi:hypothetical protein
MHHDYCYAQYEPTCPATKSHDERGKLMCDQQMLDCVNKLKGKAPENWPKRPPDDTQAYMFSQDTKTWLRFRLGQ